VVVQGPILMPVIMTAPFIVTIPFISGELQFVPLTLPVPKFAVNVVIGSGA
jgi:hypothetical protein